MQHFLWRLKCYSLNANLCCKWQKSVSVSGCFQKDCTAYNIKIVIVTLHVIKLNYFFLHQQKYVSTELIMNQLGQVSAISFWQQNETWWNFKKVYAYLRSSHRTCFVKKGVLKNFADFTGKHLCQRLFFNKIGGLRLQPYSVLHWSHGPAQHV